MWSWPPSRACPPLGPDSLPPDDTERRRLIFLQPLVGELFPARPGPAAPEPPSHSQRPGQTGTPWQVSLGGSLTEVLGAPPTRRPCGVSWAVSLERQGASLYLQKVSLLGEGLVHMQGASSSLLWPPGPQLAPPLSRWPELGSGLQVLGP